jgi:hypothetical protein
MSLNLGAQAFDAVTMLKNNDAWRAFKNALHEHVLRMGHAAIEVGTPDACGYARGMRDILWAIELIEAGPGQATVAVRKKPDIIAKAPLNGPLHAS